MIAPWRDTVRDNPWLPGSPAGVWTVILAAGGARRFGRHKLLQRIGTESLLARALRCAETVTPGRCIVVLGCAASRLRATLPDDRARVVLNRRWRTGMASSLQAGLSAVPSTAVAALVLLADQYAVGPGDLRRLVVAWSRDPSRPAAADCEGRASAPALLPRDWFPRVGNLRGDEGARRLLRDEARSPTRVPMPVASLDLDDRYGLDGFRRIARRAAPLRRQTLAKPRAGGYIR